MKNKLLLFFIVFKVFVLASVQNINIGVICDQVSQKEKNNLEIILKSELNKNFKSSNFQPIIKKVVETNSLNFKELIDKYENDVEIDVIISLATNPYNDFLGENDLKKLIIAPFCYGSSKTFRAKNLNLITTDYNLNEIVDILNNLKEIKQLGIVFSDEFKNTANFYKEKLTQKDFCKDKNVVTISLEKSSRENFHDIYENDALLILSKNTATLKGALREATKKGIPSFSFFFQKKNNAGALMGYSADEDEGRKIRVATLNLLKYYEGRDFSELEVKLGSTNLNILVNYKIAENIDIYPDDLLSEKINIINEPTVGKFKIDITDAIEKLLDKNLDLKFKEKDLLIRKYGIDIVSSFKKPKISSSFDYQKIDSLSADSDPTTSENTVKAGVSLTQVLYDESVFSNIEIQKKIYSAEKEELRQEKLNQIQNLLNSYFNLLKLYSNFGVEKYNSQLIKKYLNIAKVKYEIGSSGPEDMYRFESELADSITALEEVRGNIFSENAELSRILNMSMDNYYLPSQDKIESVISLQLFQKYEIELNKPWKLRILKNYFIQLGIENNPRLKKLDLQIEASERKLKSTKRKRYIPVLTANANYNKDISNSWGGDSDEDWSIGIGFNLPLYKGGELKYSENQAQAELEQFKIDREMLIVEIKKEISSQYAKIFTNIRKIKSAKKSLEASRKNLELQTSLYMNGEISVADMLDARNNFINADQVSTSLEYDFFIFIAELERLSGKYYFEYSNIEKEQLDKIFKGLVASKQEGK